MEWYVFALMAALLSGVAMVLQKKVLFKEHSVEFNTVSKFFQAALVLFLLPFLNFNFPWWLLVVLYFVSIFAVAAIILETKAYRHLELSSVAPLSNLSPVFLLIFAFLFLGEKIGSLQIAGISVLVLGSYFLEANHHWADVRSVFNSLRSKYVTYFFISLFIGVFLGLSYKYLVNIGINILSLVFLYYIFTWLNFTIITFLFYDGFKNIKHGIKSQGFPIFLIALFYVAHKWIYLKALTLGFISLVVPIMRTGVLLSTFIGGELFHEKHVLQRTLACAVMIFGAYLIIVG
ncbi:MAG: EamA family transporter [Nanoarchaeota archaeon]|nr:EamA family transporter [Nanoarchaeota archaeon]